MREPLRQSGADEDASPGDGGPIMNTPLLAGARSRAAAVAGLACLLAACGQDNAYVPPPPPVVSVAAPVQKTVTRYLEATGNIAVVNTAKLVARVPGFVESIGYQDGDEVKKGAVLFTIEPEPYELRLRQAQAAETATRASLAQAEAEVQRLTELASRQIGTKVALDNATTSRETAESNLKQAQVNTRLAAINLAYTRVTAPFDGIVGARQVSVGDFVGAGAATVLATIQQLDPIYVNFSINERELQLIQAMIERLGIAPDDLKKVPVEVGLQTETGHPHRGTLHYAATGVSPQTGTLMVRGILPNPKHALLPGYFVRVRVPLPQPENALLVPDVALGSDQGGRYVMVVTKDGVAEQRRVQVGPVVDELRVIESGLQPNDQVVVDGIMHAIPGQKIETRPQPAGPQRPS